MPKRYRVASTLVGGLRGPKVRDDISTVWEPDANGILQAKYRSVPVFEAVTRAEGEEVTREDYAHHGPEEFARLLESGAIREELYEDDALPVESVRRGRATAEAA